MSLSLDMLPIVVRNLKSKSIGLHTTLRFIEQSSKVLKEQKRSLQQKRRNLKKGPISRRRFLRHSHLLELESLQNESLGKAVLCLKKHTEKSSLRKLEESITHYESAQRYFGYRVKERLQPLLRDQFQEHFAA